MHARIGLYQVKPGTLDASLARIRADLLPRLEEQPGMRRDVGVLIGPDSFLSFSVWETREQANAAAEMLAGWLREHLGPTVVSVENGVGEILFHVSASIVRYTADDRGGARLDLEAGVGGPAREGAGRVRTAPRSAAGIQLVRGGAH